MEENTMLELDELLKEYGFEEELSDKEKYYVLGKIIERHNVDKDCEDFKYSKMPEESKTDEIKSNYASTIMNLDVKIINAKIYYYALDAKFKEERKLKRKETFKNMIKVFKK